MPNEMRRPIEGFEGIYEVSSLGQVESLARDRIVYYSIAETSRCTGIKKPHISRCLVGDRKSCGSYTWRYTNG